MLDTLTGHLEIVYGGVLALVIVVLLTPAVGGMARMLGVALRLCDLIPGGVDQGTGLLPHLLGAAPHRRDIGIEARPLLRLEIELRRHSLIALLRIAPPGRRMKAGPCGAGDEAQIEHG